MPTKRKAKSAGLILYAADHTGPVKCHGSLLTDDPPGVILTVAKLVPAAIDALPEDEYEARIADYQRRIEAGLPTPLFGCEQPQVPDAESLGKTLIQCWACGLIAGRAGNQCKKANDGLRRWESRMHGANTTEIYCPECFDVWGWPDEYLREVERYNRMSDECARAEALARGGAGADLQRA